MQNDMNDLIEEITYLIGHIRDPEKVSQTLE
jgi:spore maturation protein CgeB